MATNRPKQALIIVTVIISVETFGISVALLMFVNPVFMFLEALRTNPVTDIRAGVEIQVR